MKVTEIVVNAGRTFNHPYEDYSNLRPSVTLKASIEDGEDFEAVTRALQAKAEGLVEDHKRAMLSQLEDLYHFSNAQRELISLEERLQMSQMRLKELRERFPGLTTEQSLPGV